MESQEIMRILVTGAAGFIGANLVISLLEKTGAEVLGLDSMNDYYDVSLKEYRLRCIEKAAGGSPGSSWRFVKGDIADKRLLADIFAEFRPEIVVNLAAQAGVRYSITNPDSYIESNIIGFYNILEACRHSGDDGEAGVRHLIYASSSSVYGEGTKVPYSTEDRTDFPVSLYAATKKSDEILAYAYSKLYGIPATGLRFFTVYGPAGRPDMAYFGFTDKLVSGSSIKVFNYGRCLRDFTYIDDIVDGIMLVLDHAPERKTGNDGLPLPPYKIYNIGKGRPERLTDFLDILCQELVRAGLLPDDFDPDAHTEYVPMQPGDVPVTFADTEDLARDFHYTPATDLRTGLRRFAEWYRDFYKTGGKDILEK